jgi:hypothetical protein
VALFWAPLPAIFPCPSRSSWPSRKGRFFALHTLALVDGSVAVFDAKYAYDQWRPMTAIREADTDDNPDTTADPTWIQLLPTTPPFPDYPSGHALQAAAAAEVFRKYIEEEPIALHSPATEATRH